MSTAKLLELYALIFTLMYVGMLLGFLVSELGLEPRVSKIVSPLVRIARLPDEAGLAILTYAFSPAAAHGLLGALYERGVVGDVDVIAAILVGSLMVRIYYLLRFYIPYALPVLGPVLGGAYIAYAFTASLLMASIGVAYARLKGRREQRGTAGSLGGELPVSAKRRSFKEALRESARKAWKLYCRIAWKLALALGVVTVLLQAGFFKAVGSFLADKIPWLTAEQLAVVAAMIASPIAAIPVAGELYRRGLLTMGQALSALIIGRMIFISVNDMPKSALPVYTSVYGRKLGIKAYLAVWASAMTVWALLLAFTLAFIR